MDTTSTQTALPPLLNLQEISQAADYLSSTRDNLVEIVSGLSDPQWNFKPAPDRWSIAEILEHVAIIEDRVHAIVGKMPTSPQAEPDRISSDVEKIIFDEVPKRSAKVEAPPAVCPPHQWSPAESLSRFLQSRSYTLELLDSAPSLRGHVLPHPVFGPWDGYQWILAAAGHTARHTDQILEVKACPDFPVVRMTASVSLN